MSGALVAGLAIRVGAAATAPVWFDEATTGLMGQDVLHGQFPFFFYGQTFMGAADGYLHAVTFGLLGESVATLRVWAVLVSLVHAAIAALLAHRVFRAGGWAAVLALVPTPYLLKWASDARLHYGLLLVLVPLCLLLALAAADALRSPAGRTRALVVLALVAGLCWWINLLLAPVLMACALALALRRPRVGRAAFLAPVAFLLGSAPVWLFAAVYARVPIVSVPLAAPRQIAEHARDLLAKALPLVVGTPYALVTVKPFHLAALGIFGIGLVLALGDRQGNRAGRLLLGLATAIPFATALVTERGLTLATEDPRYLLPVLALLPVLLGGALARVARHRAAWAGLAGVTLVLAQGAAVAMAHPELRSREAWRTSRAAFARPAAVAAALAGRGLSAIYTHDPDVLTFASRGRVTVSHFYLADDPVRAARVDRSARVAYLAAGQSAIGFEDSLAAAGIRFEREDTPRGPLLTGFRLEPAGFREIPPAGWSATASLRPELAGHAIDRDAGTRWRTTGRPADAWLQVDLGRVHPVGMVAWLPGSYQEVPLGFRLDTSTDGTRWTVAREVPVYYGPLYWAAGHPMGRVRWGRVEARFPGRPARYVRLTHLGRDGRFPWTVRELFVYETGDPTGEPGRRARGCRSAPRDGCPARLRGSRGGAAARRGGRGQAPRVAGQRPGGPLRPGAAARAAPVPRLGAGRGRRVPGGGALGAVDRGRAPGRRRGLHRRRRGWLPAPRRAPSRRPSSGRIARAAAARVTAEPAGGDPRAATDGRAETRWSTRAPQAAASGSRSSSRRPAELGGLELDLGGAALEYPRGLAVQVARDAGWADWTSPSAGWARSCGRAPTSCGRGSSESSCLSPDPGARPAHRPDRTGRVPPVVGRGAAPARALTAPWDNGRARTELRVPHRS